LTELDVACGRANCLQTAPAEPIERESRSLVRETGRYRCIASDIHVAGLGMNHVAHHGMTDIARSNAGTPHRFPDDRCCQIAKRHVLETSAVAADSRSHGAYDDNFTVLAHEKSPLMVRITDRGGPYDGGGGWADTQLRMAAAQSLAAVGILATTGPPCRPCGSATLPNILKVSALIATLCSVRIRNQSQNLSRRSVTPRGILAV